MKTKTNRKFFCVGCDKLCELVIYDDKPNSCPIDLYDACDWQIMGDLTEYEKQ